MTVTQDEHTGLQAIEVKSATKINHHELGRQFFDWDNVEQANFLHGMQLGYQGLQGAGGVQLLYVVDAATVAGALPEVQAIVGTLHDYIMPEAAK